MGKLKNFFFEETPQETEQVLDMIEEACEYEEESCVDANVENVTQDNLIGDIYDCNGLSELTKSIFKVEELLGSLPKEMPNETKKTTVLAILKSFGLTVDEVVKDGIQRIEIINGSLAKIKLDNESVINQNKTDIEAKKIEIQELEKDNANREGIVKDTEDKIELEAKRIESLIKFIEGE